MFSLIQSSTHLKYQIKVVKLNYSTRICKKKSSSPSSTSPSAQALKQANETKGNPKHFVNKYLTHMPLKCHPSTFAGCYHRIILISSFFFKCVCTLLCVSVCMCVYANASSIVVSQYYLLVLALDFLLVVRCE